MKKNLCLWFLVIIIPAQVIAQPLISSQHTIGGNQDDRLTCMYLTRDSGYIAGGYSYSNISGEKTQDSRGSADYWIVKLSKAGNIQWDKTFGGSAIEQLLAIAQTSDGGYILGGLSESNISGEKTENSRGGSDWWILKLDKHGN